jgi:hypothetical protein
MELKSSSDPLSFLSKDRKEYVNQYKKWHLNMAPNEKLNFPCRHRKFGTPSGIKSSLINNSDLIIGSIATYPAREKSFKKVISIIVKQVDLLRVHLNGYKTIPEFLHHPKIRITTSDNYGDLRDNGKFLFAENLPSGFHITFDDDLNYPEFYVSYLISKCMQYGCKAVVGLHGTTLLKDFKRYHDRKSRITKTYRLSCETDFPVHILGTGTICYHTKNIKFGIKDIENTGMVDLWFANYCRKNLIPMICIARGANWLSDIDDVQGLSLYQEFIDSDSEQTKLVNRFNLNQAPIEITPDFSTKS